MVFESLHLSHHCCELLFLSFNVEYSEWGNTSFAFQNVFVFLKIEITKEEKKKKERIVRSVNQDMILYTANTTEYVCSHDA